MLTFEIIRNMERDEKEMKKLCKLPEQFWSDLSEYLHKKTTQSSANILEIENAKNIIKRLVERRERKLMEHALITIRTGIPPENLTQLEEKTFWQIIESLKNLRKALESQQKPQQDTNKFIVKQSIGEFVGPDMCTYSLKQDDIVSLPDELSNLLLQHRIIERIE